MQIGLKKEGQEVKQDELIAEIETDKIVLEVLSPINGKIQKIIKDEGEIVNSGELIAQIEESSTLQNKKIRSKYRSRKLKRSRYFPKLWTCRSKNA